MNTLQKATMTLARACSGNPVCTTVTIMMFYVMFNIFEGTVERLIFGERFEHIFDPLFICGFIAYAAYAVFMCAVFNSGKR